MNLLFEEKQKNKKRKKEKEKGGQIYFPPIINLTTFPVNPLFCL